MKKSFLSRLGIGFDKQNKVEFTGKLGQELSAALGAVDAERIRYLAAFGGLLGRVANADGNISEEEEQRIAAILETFSDLNEKESAAVKDIIRQQTQALAGLENHIYTRELNELADRQKKLEIASCLFAVAAADDEISPEENEAVRIIAKALMLAHSDFIAVRSLYRDKLSVLKNMPGRGV